MAKTNNIDLALTVMCVVAKQNQTLNTYEIAEICGCSQTIISKTLRNALKKLRGKAGEKLRDFLI